MAHQGQGRDAALLLALAQRALGEAVVPGFQVPRPLEPAPGPHVQGEQHLGGVRREHQQARREVVGDAGAPHPVRVRLEVCDVRLPQPCLVGVRHRARGRRGHGRVAQGHGGRRSGGASRAVGRRGRTGRAPRCPRRPGRVVEVLGAGQQVGVVPDRRRARRCLGPGRAPPTGPRPRAAAGWRVSGRRGSRRSAPPARRWPCGDGPSRAAPRPTGARSRPGDDGVHPALDEREQGLEPVSAACWAGGRLGRAAPPAIAPCTWVRSLGSMPRTSSSRRPVSTVMPAA